MNKKITLILSPIIGLILYLTLSSASGGSGLAGLSTSGCAGGSCHGSAVSATTTIALSGLPAAGYAYGVSYPLTISITNTSITPGFFGLRDGFIISASTGSFTAIPGTTLNSPTELRHSTPQLCPTGTATWTFNWTAPSSGTATVNFNIAGNATNGDGGASALDQFKLYTTTLIKAPIFTASASASAIACNGGLSTITASSVNGTAPITYKLNAGTYVSSNIFNNNVAGTYTITAKDATNATSSTVLTITQPVLLAFNTPSVTNPICNGGTGSISITATGGTGTKTYSITPLPQSNTTGIFNALPAQNYTITVTDANSCTLSTVVTITQPAPITVTSANVSGCQGSPITLIGSPAGGTFSLPNPYTGPSTSYTYTYTNGIGCTNTSTPSSITVTPVNSSNIVTSGSVCETLNQVSGTNVYSNSSCQLIANINASGLGSTISCINFLPGTPVWNGEPYANRVYSITPTVQPSSAATICLYYTPADLLAAGITADSNISITKVGGNGVLGGPGLVTEILNSSMTITTLTGGNKEVCFPVSSFSSFYLHSKNPNNIALPVSLKEFKGLNVANSDVLQWTTTCEINNQYFNLQHSQDGANFNTIGKIESKAKNQNSCEVLEYSFTNYHSFQGINYYRLEQVGLNEDKTYSRTISLYRAENNDDIFIYPNPSKGEFNIITHSLMSVIITDIQGKEIINKVSMNDCQIHIDKQGFYIVRFTDLMGNIKTRKLIVE